MDPNTRQAKRSPVTLKIKFKSATLEEFIERYAVDVSHGGIFIRTKEPLAVGTTMKFEFQLKDATPLIGGEGTVVWTRENDPARPGVAPGMGVRFDRLAEGSQTVLDRILAQKAKSGATSASTVDPKVFDQPTRAFGANEAPTRVAPSPLGAMGAAATATPQAPAPKLGAMAPPKSGFQDERTDMTPLPNPVPFHSDADEFPEEAFEEATKVRSMEELVAQTAKTDDGVARPSPSSPPADAAATAAAAAATSAVDELAARRAAKDPEPEPAPAPAPKAEAKAEPKAEAKPKAEPKPAAAKPVSKPEPRAKTADKAAPAPAKEPAPPPESSSSLLPVLVILMLLVGGAAAAYFLWYKKRGEPTDGGGSGSVVQKGTGSASGSTSTIGSGTGSASASGTGTASGTAVASGSGSATGTGTSAMGGAPDAGVVAVEPVTVTIGASVKGAQVEIVGTAMTGTAPYKAKLEPGKSYTARVTAPGYLPTELEVTSDAPTVTATLAAMPVVLHIESNPSGAAIYIESEITGKVTPADITLTAKQAAKPQLRVTLRKANFDKADVVVRKSAFTADGDQLVASTSGSLRPTKKSGGGGGGGGSGTSKGSGSGTASGTSSGSGTASGTGTASGSGSGSGSASGTTSGSGSGSGSGTSSGSGSGTSSGSGSAKPGSGSGTAKPGSGSGTGTSSEPTPDWAG